jgi:peptidoglycan hydrolase-like protein with peptidoglycan-binding domain
MTFITRAQWGARPPKSNGNAIGAHPLGVAVHYSAANLGSSPDSLCDDKVRGIQNYHIDHNGWADIAYSFLVCPHGNVFEGRGTGKGSAANGTTQGNLDYYAVCALGGPKDTPSVLMLDSIGDAIGLCRNAGAAAKVIGHRDLFPTACPGTALYAYVRLGGWAKLVVKVKAAVVRVVAPSRSDTRPPIAKPARVRLAVDGDFGPLSKKRLQQWAGVAQDGDLGPISWKAIQRKVGGLAVDGAPGPLTWRRLQTVVGSPADGIPGPVTYRALQSYLNSH